jgi:hypothetical protein
MPEQYISDWVYWPMPRVDSRDRGDRLDTGHPHPLAFARIHEEHHRDEYAQENERYSSNDYQARKTLAKENKLCHYLQYLV